MLNSYQIIVKRLFDFTFSLLGIVLFIPVFLIIVVLIKIFSRGPVLFIQERVAKEGKLFKLIKFRTMKTEENLKSTITIKGDKRVTKIGFFLRKWKLDELPSLWNVLKGDMSFVGPRPDVPGYADKLCGDDRIILNLKPGITGPATLKYSNEEVLLSRVKDPKKYNDEIIFPDKVRINLDYIYNWTFFLDLVIIYKTIFRKNY